MPLFESGTDGTRDGRQGHMLWLAWEAIAVHQPVRGCGCCSRKKRSTIRWLVEARERVCFAHGLPATLRLALLATRTHMVVPQRTLRDGLTT